MKMNNILIPTDFSENSNYALEYASFIAKVRGDKLVILHITKAEEKEKSQFQLEETKRLPFFDGLEIEIVVRAGKNLSKIIKRVGIEYDVRLIIMGSNGISNFGELLLGSNTENVIRKSPFNVLTIKHKMLSLELGTVLFPSDFSPESYKVFETVKEFADTFNAKIHLLRIVTSEKDENSKKIIKNMNLFIKHFQLDERLIKRVIYKDKTRELGVLNYSIDNDIDMIAIGSHGKGIVRKLVKESISQDLVRNTFKPILTVRF